MRTNNERNLLDTQLIQLSYIFKDKFIVKILHNKLNQYDITDSPYEDRINYKTIIEIKEKRIIFKNGKIPDICIIKGYYDKSTETYFIDLQL